jgi:membrane protein
MIARFKSLVAAIKAKVMARPRLSKLVEFMKQVWNGFFTDNCPHLAAAISYYALLCIFPLTLALVSVLGFISHSPAMKEQVIEVIGSILPPGSAEFITKNIEGIVSTRGITGVIGVIGLLIGGNAIFTALRKSLNAAWGIRQPRPFLTERIVELSMMIGSAVLILLAIGLTAALNVIQRANISILGLQLSQGAPFWNVITGIIATAIVFIVFLFLYKFVPNTKVRWKDIWLWALLAAVGFVAGTSIFVWYAANFAHYDVIYGSIGGIIALLVWVYVSAIILLFCAKMASVYATMKRASLAKAQVEGISLEEAVPRG